jgi:hypothetical protein
MSTYLDEMEAELKGLDEEELDEEMADIVERLLLVMGDESRPTRTRCCAAMAVRPLIHPTQYEREVSMRFTRGELAEDD